MTANDHQGTVPPYEAVLGFRFVWKLGAFDDYEPRVEWVRDTKPYITAIGDTLERWWNERDEAFAAICDLDAVLAGTKPEFYSHCDDSLIIADADRFTSRWSIISDDIVETEGTTVELRELLAGWFEWCDAHVLWRMPQRVILKKDDFSSPIWDAGGARGGLDYSDIFVAHALELRLRAWSDTFDANFDEQEGRNSGFADEADLAAFEAESIALAEAMRSEMNDAYRIDRFSYLTGTIEPDPRGEPPVPPPAPPAPPAARPRGTRGWLRRTLHR